MLFFLVAAGSRLYDYTQGHMRGELDRTTTMYDLQKEKSTYANLYSCNNKLSHHIAIQATWMAKIDIDRPYNLYKCLGAGVD